MSSPNFESVLAKIYVDETARAAFLAAPEEFALAQGLNQQEARDLAAIDRTGLAMTAHSFAHKRAKKEGSPQKITLLDHILFKWRLRHRQVS